MRDAFGGEFMVRLMLVFIVIYVSFSALSLNYAKAFRIKNKVISYIEENNINNIADIDCGTLGRIITKNQYNKSCNLGNGAISDNNNNLVGYCCNGVIIQDIGEDSNTHIYEINTYADWNMGALNMILSFGGQKQNSRQYVNGTWEISGDAYVKKRK